MARTLKVAIYKGSQLLEERTFEGEMIKIGRLASAHLRLDDPKVSRIHALLEASPDGLGYSVIDMGSSDGTFVNGERVSKAKIKDADEIQIGDCRLVIAIDEHGAKPSISSERPAVAPDRAPAPPTGVSAVLAAHAAAAEQALGANAPETARGPAVSAHVFAGPSAGMQMHGVSTEVLPPPPPPPGYVSIPPEPVDVSQIASAVSYAPGELSARTVAAGPVIAPSAATVAPAHDVAYASATAAPMPPPAANVLPTYAYGAPPAYAPPPPSYAPPPQMMAAPGMGYPMGVETAPPYMMPYAPEHAQEAPEAVDEVWGTVPNNLASQNVPENERALEIKLLWGATVLETRAFETEPEVRIGDEPRLRGFGPFKTFIGCEFEVPSKGLPEKSFVFAKSMGAAGTNYQLNIPGSFQGHLEKPDGSWKELSELLRGERAGGQVANYHLNPEETLYLHHGDLTFQVRYVRAANYVAPPLFERLNYTWVNTLILVIFFHILAVASFIATPRLSETLDDSLFKNPNQFIATQFKQEQQKKENLLKDLKKGEQAAKAKGAEGKAGHKNNTKKPDGRMAAKQIKPDDKTVAQDTLAKLLGAKGATSRSHLLGTGGLGGELNAALGGVSGAAVGDASGLGGLGTRGGGPGGGGLSATSVGLGALGTAGRGGGGDGDYGRGVGNLGKKASRDIDISQGEPRIAGSLDKELIRRVINAHKNQIRYCYEKELVRTPGLFGKVEVQWTIDANGAVQGGKIDNNTMANDEVGRCIVSKIRTWTFPKPNGGGIVIVKYPFVFKTSG